MPAAQTLPHEESSQIFALLQPNEEFMGTSKQIAASAAPVSSSRVSFDVQSDGYATTPSSPSGAPRAKGPTLPIPAQHASAAYGAGAYGMQEVPPSRCQGFASPSSRGSSVPSRDWMALQLRSRHLQLENSQLTQRCQTLQARCQQLQCQRMAFQEQLESAQREARRFEMEVNFLRLGVAQGLLNRP